MTDTTKLPPLPNHLPFYGLTYSREQILAYGAECRRAALDEAAQAIDRGASALVSHPAKTAADFAAHGLLLKLLSELSSAIRALKDKA